MKSQKLRRFLTLSVVLLVMAIMVNPIVYHSAYAGNAPQFVHDDTNIFSNSEINTITKECEYMYSKYDFPIVVHIIDSFNGEDPNTYADNFFSLKNMSSRSLLLTLSIRDRELNDFSGRECPLSKNIIDEYINNYAMPYFAEGKFASGFVNLIKNMNGAFLLPSSKTEGNYTLILILITLAFVLFICLLYLSYRYKKLKKEVASILSHQASIKTQNKELIVNNRSLQDEIETLKEKLRLSLTVHPNLDEEIKIFFKKQEEDRNKLIARPVNEQLEACSLLDASPDNVQSFLNCLKEYMYLTPEQRKFIEPMILEKVQYLHKTSLEESMKEKAKRVEKNINTIISKYDTDKTEVSSFDYPILHEAIQQCSDLGEWQKLVSPESIQRLNLLHTIALKAKQAEEAEQREFNQNLDISPVATIPTVRIRSIVSPPRHFAPSAKPQASANFGRSSGTSSSSKSSGTSSFGRSSGSSSGFGRSSGNSSFGKTGGGGTSSGRGSGRKF